MLKERSMVIVQHFISFVKEHRKHPVSTDGGTWYIISSLLQIFKTKHHINFLYSTLKALLR
jgi:putative transposase